MAILNNTHYPFRRDVARNVSTNLLNIANNRAMARFLNPETRNLETCEAHRNQKQKTESDAETSSE